jgi:uncharacterized membrane protein YvbJ
MFCSFCGEKNSDGFRFCSSCGKQRNSNDSEIQTQSQSLSEFKEIANTVHVYFSGNDGKTVGQTMANSL